jgi:hypothetical protein
MIIQLNTPIKRSTDITTVEVSQVVDRNSAKTVIASVSVENVGVVDLTLWEGDAYTAIGQWTDSQVQSRVLELINERYK